MAVPSFPPLSALLLYSLFSFIEILPLFFSSLLLFFSFSSFLLLFTFFPLYNSSLIEDNQKRTNERKC